MHGLKSGSCRFWRIKFSLERFSDQSRIRLRAQPLESSLGRVPQAPRFSHALRLEMGNKCRKTTRVAHFRGSTLQCLRESVCVSSRCWHALLLEMGNKSRKTTRVAHFRGSTLKCLRASACVPSRWKVLSGEFRRRPTALVIKFRKPDLVGRRGLSEPREDFSRLTTYAFPWLLPWLYFAAACALRIAPSDKARNMLPPAPQSSAIWMKSRTSSSRSPRVKATVPSHSSIHDSWITPMPAASAHHRHHPYLMYI